MTSKDQLATIEQQVADLIDSLTQAREEFARQLVAFGRALHDADWDRADQMAERVAIVETALRTEAIRTLEEMRKTAFDFQTSVENWRRFFARSPEVTNVTPSEAVNELVRVYLARGASLIGIEEVLGDLGRQGYQLVVKNPRAVVSSILARHPRLIKKPGQPGAYLRKEEATENLEEIVGDDQLDA